MGRSCILFVRTAVADVGFHFDQGRLPSMGFCLFQRPVDGAEVVSVFDAEDVPAVRPKARCHIFGERFVRLPVQGNVVRVVQHDEAVQFQVPGEGGGFGRNTFHQVAVADDRVRVVVDHGVFRLIEGVGQKTLSHGEADGVGKPLSEGTGRRFHTGRHAVFRMTRGFAPPLAEVFQLVQGQVVAA